MNYGTSTNYIIKAMNEFQRHGKTCENLEIQYKTKSKSHNLFLATVY